MKRSFARPSNILSLVVLAALFNGCATTATFRAANGYKTVDHNVIQTDERKPYMYLLLPITIPFDIGTFPIQAPFLPVPGDAHESAPVTGEPNKSP